MDIENGYWWVCDYEIKEITPDIEKFHLGPLRVISAKKDSPVRFYNPFIYKEKIEHEVIGKKSYQPQKADGEEWPPHMALARLDTTNKNAIQEFASTYGPLGLWFTDKPLNQLEFSDYHRRTCSQTLIDSIDRDDLEHGGGYRKFFEPLDSFIATAQKYQSAYDYLMAIKEKKKGRHEFEIWSNFKQIAEPYLQEIKPHVGRDTNTGLPTIVWDFKNLINCCYFRLIQDIQGNIPKRCGRKRCNRPFLAKNIEENYCSKECYRMGNMANLSIRRIKNELRDMEKRGEIDKPMRWLAGSEAQELYNDGLRDYEELLRKTLEFIKN